MNQLILGDCLEVLRKLDSESVDLIYIDPPFFSNRNYEVIWGDQGEMRSFQDRWSGGINHYIDWLKERVQELHRVLKSTGSIFIHCDWHANSYIRIFILDKIFGENNLKGEIIWQRHNAHNDATKKIAVLKDTLWYYSKSEKFIYNTIYGKYDKNYLTQFYKHKDKNGYFTLSDLANPSKLNKNGLYEYKGYLPPVNGWRCPVETMEKWDSEGLIYFPEKTEQRLRFKRYLDESKGVLLGDIWTDIQNVQGLSKERIGYPTQKPEALLERIIKCASNEGDIVLDCFVGGGTTVAVADKLNRNWIGIDQSVAAIKVTEYRLNAQQGKVINQTQQIFANPFTVQLHKYDYDTLRYKEAFAFENWIIQQFDAIPNIKQRSDLGIDGKTRDNVPIQVKRSDNVGRNVIDNFKSAIERFDKNLFEKNKTANSIAGFIIAFSFSKTAIEEVARLKSSDNLHIKLIRVEEIIPIAKKPNLKITFQEIGINKNQLEVEFIAHGTSDNGIEFYAWDFNYQEQFNPSIFIDKIGKQIHQFKSGEYKIAVKVVDNEGLENLEILNLKINGKTAPVMVDGANEIE